MTADPFAVVAASLRRWDRRRRRQELLVWLPRGFLGGALLGLAAALLSRARPLLTREEVALWSMGLAVGGLIIAAAVVLARRRSLTERARFADRQFGLRERMIAAVEIREGRLPASEPLAGQQLQDAAATAVGVDAGRAMPLRIRPVDWLPALAALILLAGLIALPNPQEAALLEQRAVAAEVAQQAAALTTLAEAINADESLTAEQREALTQPLDEARAALAEPNMSREEAVAALSGAETELRALSVEIDPDALADALAAAGASLEGNEAAAELAEALQSGDAGQAAGATQALGDTLPGLELGEQAELAQRLAEAAEVAPDSPAAEAMARAAEALAAGDMAAAQAALDEAAAALDEQAQNAATAEQAAQAAEQLGEAAAAVAQSGMETAGGEGGAQPGQNGNGATGDEAGGEGQAGGQTGSSAGGGPTAGGGHVENVFVPAPVTVDEEGENVELDAACLADPAACGPLAGQSPSELPGETGSVVPYDQVFGNYRDAAFEALAGGEVPLSLQNLVRDYFAALEPAE
jgi:hypothetical protein